MWNKLGNNFMLHWILSAISLVCFFVFFLRYSASSWSLKKMFFFLWTYSSQNYADIFCLACIWHHITEAFLQQNSVPCMSGWFTPPLREWEVLSFFFPYTFRGVLKVKDSTKQFQTRLHPSVVILATGVTWLLMLALFPLGFSLSPSLLSIPFHFPLHIHHPILLLFPKPPTTTATMSGAVR